MKRPGTHNLFYRPSGFRALLMITVLLTGCSEAFKGDTLLEPLIRDLFPPTPAQAARDAFNVYDPDKRRQSVALISAAPFGGEEPYVKMYRLLLDDPDASVRAACIKALGLHGRPEDVPRIMAYLSDRHAFVRWEAAQALQKLHHPIAVTALLRALREDEDPDVRQAAAEALGQYAEPRVFEALVGALDDPDFGVAQAARKSLVTLCGYDFGIDASLWLIWARQHSRDLFANQQVYLWQPFVRPRSWLDRLMFWKPYEPPAPRLPTGLRLPERTEAGSG